MKKCNHSYLFLGLSLCLTLFACQKSLTDAQPHPTGQTQDSTILPIVKPDSTAKPTAPYPQAPVSGCSYAPNYGDSIIYPQPVNSQDYVVKPINNPGPGKYFSWPVGMVIDSLSGAIDVTQSQTGMKYAIGFVKSGTTDTCLNTLIIGGASYMDSVYVLSDGATTAVPYFEANPYLPAVCSGGACSFDVTGSAAGKRVVVNPSTGVIDLKKTLDGSSLLGGAFGLIPLNGVTASATIYYRLNDPSNNALQHIDLQFIYYYSKSQIGQGLLANVLTKLDNILSGNLISLSSNPRPPLIIIVRSK